MRGCLALTLAVLLAGCASASAGPDAAPAAGAPPVAAKPRCEAPTGTRVARCGTGDNIEVISRQELEARGLPLGGGPPLLDKPGAQ